MQEKQNLPKMETTAFTPVEKEPAWNALPRRQAYDPGPRPAMDREGAGKSSRGKTPSGERVLTPEQKEQKKLARLLIKTGVCAAICLAVFLIKTADTPVSREITDGIKSVLTYSVDIDDTLGRLKFVGNTIPGVTAVFGDGTVTTPINAPVSQTYSQNGRGIVFSPAAGKNVMTAADGTVTMVGENDEWGKYVEVTHSETVKSVYLGLNAIEVAEGMSLKSGDKLGIAADQLLLEIYDGAERQDPLAFFESI